MRSQPSRSKIMHADILGTAELSPSRVILRSFSVSRNTRCSCINIRCSSTRNKCGCVLNIAVMIRATFHSSTTSGSRSPLGQCFFLFVPKCADHLQLSWVRGPRITVLASLPRGGPGLPRPSLSALSRRHSCRCPSALFCASSGGAEACFSDVVSCFEKMLPFTNFNNLNDSSPKVG